MGSRRVDGFRHLAASRAPGGLACPIARGPPRKAAKPAWTAACVCDTSAPRFFSGGLRHVVRRTAVRKGAVCRSMGLLEEERSEAESGG